MFQKLACLSCLYFSIISHFSIISPPVLLPIPKDASREKRVKFETVGNRTSFYGARTGSRRLFYAKAAHTTQGGKKLRAKSPEKPICPITHLTVAAQAPASWSPAEVARQEVWALFYTQKLPTSQKWFSIILKAVRATCWFSWSCKASILSTPPSSSIRRHRFSFSESFSAAWGWEREARFWAKA